MSPLGMTVLVIAFFGIVATIVWAFWEKQRAGFSQNVSSDDNLRPVAPPQLKTELMSPSVTNSVSSGGAGDSVLRNILIAVLVIGALLVGLQYFLKGETETKVTKTETETKTADNGDGEQTFGEPVATKLPCDEGPIWTDRRGDSETFVGTEREPIKSYRICAGKQAATFDVIDFSAEGQPLLQPVWKPKNEASLGTFNDDFYAKTEFVLSSDEFDMIAGPGAYLEEYDLFLAVGLAGFEIPEGVAVQRASNRGFHIARYVLDELRGELPVTDCASQATVYALSVGQYHPGGRIAAAEVISEGARAALEDSEPVGQMIRQSSPVLFGVRYDTRTLAKDREPKALIEDFLRSQGADLAGFNLRDFGPHQTLFVEKACSGAGSL